MLRPAVGGEKELSADGSSVGEILRSVADEHPDTQTQLFAADGGLNRYVNVYLNDEDVRVLDGLETAVGASDTLVILPAMAGGALLSASGRRSPRGFAPLHLSDRPPTPGSREGFTVKAGVLEWQDPVHSLKEPT